MPETGSTFPKDRIVALTDGVIAIVITLLVLELSIPVVKELPDSEGLWPEIRAEWREYLAFVVSFFIVGILWLYHHTVWRRILKANGTLLFLNMVFLAAVSITPFTSAMVARNWDERLAAIIYGASIFLAAAANAVTFAYASRGRRLVASDLSSGFIRRENGSAVALLAILAVASSLGYVTPYATYVILGVLVTFYWVITALNREGVSARRHSAA